MSSIKIYIIQICVLFFKKIKKKKKKKKDRTS